MFGPLINKHALAMGLRPDVVAAVIIQESNGEPFAARYEDAFYQALLANKKRQELAGFVPYPTPTLATEKRLRATSIGLMQVMGDSARWIGKVTANYLTVLCEPDIGIEVGCKVLKFYLDKERGDYHRALSRYNSGRPDSQRGMRYAEEVLGRVSRGEHLRFFSGQD